MLRAEIGLIVGLAGPEGEEVVVLEESVETAEAETKEDTRGECAAAFASDKDVGACGAFGVDKVVVLFDDELAAKRNHEENAEPSAEESEREDAGRFEIEAKEDESGKCEDDTGRDGLASVAGALNDVVFEDAGFAERSQDGDGQNRDGNGCGDRETSTETDIYGDSTEENAEDCPEDERSCREFRAGFCSGDEGFEGWFGRCGCCHDRASPALVKLGFRLRWSVSAGE